MIEDLHDPLLILCLSSHCFTTTRFEVLDSGVWSRLYDFHIWVLENGNMFIRVDGNLVRTGNSVFEQEACCWQRPPQAVVLEKTAAIVCTYRKQVLQGNMTEGCIC